MRPQPTQRPVSRIDGAEPDAGRHDRRSSASRSGERGHADQETQPRRSAGRRRAYRRFGRRSRCGGEAREAEGAAIAPRTPTTRGHEAGCRYDRDERRSPPRTPGRSASPAGRAGRSHGQARRAARPAGRARAGRWRARDTASAATRTKAARPRADGGDAGERRDPEQDREDERRRAVGADPAVVHDLELRARRSCRRRSRRPCRRGRPRAGRRSGASLPAPRAPPRPAAARRASRGNDETTPPTRPTTRADHREDPRAAAEIGRRRRSAAEPGSPAAGSGRRWPACRSSTIAPISARERDRRRSSHWRPARLAVGRAEGYRTSARPGQGMRRGKRRGFGAAMTSPDPACPSTTSAPLSPTMPVADRGGRRRRCARAMRR